MSPQGPFDVPRAWAGGITMKKLVFTLLAVSFLTGMAAAEYSLKNNVTLDMKQSVSGEGYFVTYKHARMPNTMGNAASNGVELLDYGHGSGNINLNSVMLAQSSNRSEGAVEDAAMDYQEALSCIRLKEDNSMVYSPVSIGLGVGYYAAGGLNYNSLLKEKTWLKNRDGSTMMNHEVEYAHALDKDLEARVKSFISQEDPSMTMLSVSEDVTSGKTHIGLLQGDPSVIMAEGAIARSAWNKPLAEVDEDFIGSFHIEKMMNLTSSLDETTADDDWLPCCSGGYLDMPPYYQKGSRGFGSDVTGIFDCSCYKVPDKAEFPG
jgi:hypothetical protein